MASVNPLSRELVFKIVYYGPGLGGKTTTLEHIHATAKPDHRGKLVSLATPVDRTLYFDFLPMRLPPIRGMHVRLQLFTVPGQVYFNATRKLVLTGADGIVFVADSQIARADANLESLDNLRDNLADQGRNLTDVPIVFQYNKHDLPDILSVAELDKLINRWNAPSLATSAHTGLGVYESLEKITHAVLSSFETQMPESVRVSAAAAFNPNEEGLAAALRGASQGEDRPPTSGAIFNRVASSRVTVGSIPPETGVEEAPPIVDKVAIRAPSMPVTTFPEVPDDGWGSKEKLAITSVPDTSVLTRTDSVRAHSTRSPESRSGESPRSRNRPSVLPPKPFAPLIPHAAPQRAPAAHAPAPPPNATTTIKEATPPLTSAHAPAPPHNATTTNKEATPPLASAHAPAPPPNATVAASAKSFSNTDKAPSTEKTVAVPAKAQPALTVKPEVVAATPAPAPVKVEVVPAKPEPAPHKVEVVPAKPEPAPHKVEVVPAKPEPEKTAVAVPTAAKQKQPAPFERLDPTQLFSIADLLEPPSDATGAAATSAPQVAKVGTPNAPAIAETPRPSAIGDTDSARALIRIASEPEPAPKVEHPMLAVLEPLRARKSSLPPAISGSVVVPEASAVLAPAPATPRTTGPRTAPTRPAMAAVAVSVAESPKSDALPAPPPPPPARPIGAIHTIPEPQMADSHVPIPSTSKDSSRTNVAPTTESPVETTEARKHAGLSFADLWPEADRSLVHDIEAAIAAGQCWEAIEQTDTLVTRMLTSVATLFGSADATREAMNMPLMLGIDGRRYLAFRSIVRASRGGAQVSAHDALAAYAFAIETRMAKSSVG